MSLADPDLFGLKHSGALVRHRQLKHRGLLALYQKRQKNNLTVWKFQRIVMRNGIIFVDLTEDRSPVFDLLTPRPQTLTPHIFCERQLSTG